MTHKKKYNSGRIIGAGIVILGWAFYFVFSGNFFIRNQINTNTTPTSNYSCPMKNIQGWGWCGGTRTSITSNTTPITTNTVDTKNTYETVNIWHSAYALDPETVSLVAGKNYKLVITPTADGAGCMNNMTIAWLDSKVYPVKKWVSINIIINDAKAGRYEVVCGNMWMHQGNIVIQ